MKIKKMLSTVLAAAMLMGTMSGCTKNDTSEKDGITTVSIWGNGAGVNVEAEIAQKFNESIGAQKGIKIDYQVKEGDIQEQIEIALQSGSAPDIFRVGKVKEMAEKKYIAPLTAFEGGQEIFDKAVANGGSDQEDVTVADGVPYTITNSILTWGLIYNVDMFKEAGLVDENGNATPPETWDEFREYAKKLTNKEKRQYGTILPMKWGGWFDYDILHSAASSSPNLGFNTETMQYDYSDMNGLFNILLGIRDDGSCYPGSEGIDNDPARARFAEGNIGMKISVSWDSGVFKEQFVPNFDWSVAPIPTYSKDEKYKQFMMLTNGLFINSNVVGTPKQEAVFEVWKYWHGEGKAKILFEEGISIPLDYEQVKDIETDIKGWKEFAQMKEISAAAPNALKTLTAGETTLKELFVNEVWNGKMTAEEATIKYSEIANAGIEKYYEQNKTASIEEDKKLVNENSLR